MEGIPVVTQKEFQKDLAELRTKILALEARERLMRSDFEELRIACLGYQDRGHDEERPAIALLRLQVLGIIDRLNNVSPAETKATDGETLQSRLWNNGYKQIISRLQAVNTEQKIRLDTVIAQADFLQAEVHRLRQKVAEHERS